MARHFAAIVSLHVCTLALFAADPLPSLPDEILVLPPVSRYGRTAIPIDPVHAKIAANEWKAPSAGDGVAGPDGKSRAWTKLPLKAGGIQHAALNGGYAFLNVPSTSERAVLLEAAGPLTVIVNGEPRAGDMYGNGSVTLPIRLRKGDNHFLFHVARGSLRFKWREAKSSAQFHMADATTPDLLIDTPIDVEAALCVLNTEAEFQSDLWIETTLADGKPVLTNIPSIPSSGIRKVGFRIRGEAKKSTGKETVALRLLRKTEGTYEELDKQTLTLEVKKPSDTHRRTFRSEIDGSLQYYSLVPAIPDAGKKSGLVLTLHGASVEAAGQAASYAPKKGMHIVAPTNRRPFGFDWEDWGRLDAIEVLERAQRDLGTDRARTYLTGHSMGGHGTWHIGATYPDRFAAIGPSAGWVSMWSYAGMKRAEGVGVLDELILRSANPSDTLALVRNYAMQGVYVLHGDADDNVPVDQARTMRKALADFHPSFAYHEEAGMGHWWGKEGVSGAACVDWPAMFQLFETRRISDRKTLRELNFTTASPGVSADCHWLRIEAQAKSMLASSVNVRRDLAKRKIEGATTNVVRLSFDLAGFEKGPLLVSLDGTEIANVEQPADGSRLVLTRTQEKWSVGAAASAKHKGPDRYGPFRDAFRRKMQFVYGTKGTPEENAWALAKARYDAEQFWYRGNGSVDVVPDTSFDSRAEPNRNVILYGHAQSNMAWPALLKDSPVQARRGMISVGDREEKGDDLAALFVHPRPGSDVALVGVVTGSGVAGFRITDRIPYFVSGVGLPDWIVIGAESFATGRAGVRGAGYFGVDWSLENGETSWRK